MSGPISQMGQWDIRDTKQGNLHNFKKNWAFLTLENILFNCCFCWLFLLCCELDTKWVKVWWSLNLKLLLVRCVWCKTFVLEKAQSRYRSWFSGHFFPPHFAFQQFWFWSFEELFEGACEVSFSYINWSFVNIYCSFRYIYVAFSSLDTTHSIASTLFRFVRQNQRKVQISRQC